jgi:hypothetical protein
LLFRRGLKSLLKKSGKQIPRELKSTRNDKNKRLSGTTKQAAEEPENEIPRRLKSPRHEKKGLGRGAEAPLYPNWAFA